MSMDWNGLLEEGEQLLWSGRPAPRCYTFRNWKHSLVGLLLVLIGVWWQAIGLQMAALYQVPYLAWIPLPVCLGGLYLAFGHLLKSRLEWEYLFYAVTDRRLLCRHGKKARLQQLSRDAVTYFRLKPYSPRLGSLAIYAGSAEQRLDFKCIELPRRVTELLEESLCANGVLAPESD
jgi:hypothetical protein